MAPSSPASPQLSLPPPLLPAKTGAAPPLVREQLRQEGSRHRYQWQPPATQEGFWNMVRLVMAELAVRARLYCDWCGPVPCGLATQGNTIGPVTSPAAGS